ncbi:hypothetical protein [Escherichia sp. MOD1-EC7003]|uniref:hypothetical protein n=1 Tax=Escherichia sp. MOD1-EC7003 TaxID=2093900 RepID=UPI001F544142|nr:hypothetical protein [Escherichia sp. MOD1-EC7003]
MVNLNGGGSPGIPVRTLQPAILKALSDDTENKTEKQSLRFAFPGADRSVETTSWLIDQPYKISDSNGDVLVSGTIEQSGRLPRVMLDEPDELTLTMGSEEWEVENLASEDDDSSSDDVADDDGWYDLENDPYYGRLEQDEQWPSDADINELLDRLKG